MVVGLDLNGFLTVTSQNISVSFCERSCHMLLNQTLPLAISTASSRGSSSGDLLTEVLVLHGQGMDGFSRAPQWFADMSTRSAEQDPDLIFCSSA